MAETRTFKGLTQDELELYEAKNHDYAGGGDPFGNFNRVATIFALYPNLKLSDPRVVNLCYMMKQLDSAMWMLNEGYDGTVENIDTRLRDVHVYAKICRLLEGKIC